jgi:hypothetical protein
MRERIEHGEQADLFASADIGHARTLVEQGRATVILFPAVGSWQNLRIRANAKT